MARWQRFGEFEVAREAQPGFADPGILADAGPPSAAWGGEDTAFVRQKAIAYPTGCAV